MNKLKNYILYGGATAGEYYRCLPEIRKSSRKRLKTLLWITIFFLLAAMGIAAFAPVSQGNFLLYAGSLVLVVVLLVSTVSMPGSDDHALTVYISTYIVMLYMIGLCIAMLSERDVPSVTFIAFLLTVPVLFVQSPLRNITFTVMFDALFIIIVHFLKSGDAAMLDLINGVIFGAISCIVSTVIMCTRIDNFVVRDRLANIASTDQTTKLKNRTAYALHHMEYPERCKKTLTCVYVDINGLHEVNNTQGHQAGDIMLAYIATEFRRQFGDEDAYRMGGDEYLAMLPDIEERHLQGKIKAFTRAIEARHYHAAIGWVTMPVKGIEIDELTQQAEQRMYADKEAYYALKGRKR